jgi:hypothetical protein
VAVPFALLFGVGDGGGFLLGTAFHWSISDSVSSILQATILVALGIYWIAIAILAKKAAEQQQSKPRWGVWILPWALSIDNITYGLVGPVPRHFAAWGPLLLPYWCSMALWGGRWRWLPNSVDARPWPAYS